MTFDPNLIIWHKCHGSGVLVTKFGWNWSRHVKDISLGSVARRKKERKKELDIRLCHLDDIDPAAGFFRTPKWPKIDLWPQGIDRVRVFSWCMVLAIMIMVCKIVYLWFRIDLHADRRNWNACQYKNHCRNWVYNWATRRATTGSFLNPTTFPFNYLR